MTYRLKRIRYKDNANCHILLQNENGPCPLLAAANGLLLRGTLQFPAHCLQHQVASLEDVTNMLANQALASDSEVTEKLYIDELLQWIPQFQHGMDVNLGFRRVDQYEYTAQLTAWDMFRMPLVHGWLVDPQSAEADIIQNFTYNVLVERIIQARDAATELEQLEKESVDYMTCSHDTLVERQARIDRLQHVATQGTLLEHFLESTSHQLTVYGLEQLRKFLSNDQLVVFFRNNHFALMTKHEDQLYLLVTDLGYADSHDIVWERLDTIDGNTTLVNSDFSVNSRQEEEEAFQMALQMSLQQQQDDQQRRQELGTLVPLPSLTGPCGGLPEELPGAKETVVAVGVPFATHEGPREENDEVPALARGATPLVPASQSGSFETFGANDATPRHIDSDVILAKQLQADWNSEAQTDEAASLQLARQLQGDDSASLHLARQLQAQEDARARQGSRTVPPAAPQRSGKAPSSQAGCQLM